MLDPFPVYGTYSEETTWKPWACVWKQNIKVDRREITWKGVEFLHLAHDLDECRAVVYTTMNFLNPYPANVDNRVSS